MSNNKTDNSQENSRSEATTMKHKGNKGLKIACTLLSLAVLALGGYLGYDKFILPQQQDQTESASTTSEKTKETTSEKKEQVKKNDQGFTFQTNIGNTYVGNFFIDKKGDVYYEPDDQVIQSSGVWKGLNFKDNTIDGVSGTFSIARDEINYHPNGVDGSEHKFNGYKLKLKNIIGIFEIGIGQQPVGGSFLAVDDEGNCFMIGLVPSWADKANATLKISQLKYKEIISAVITNTGDGVATVLTDKNGSHFYMTDEDFIYE